VSDTTTAPPRRTQAERTATTRARLLDAAIDVLVDLGYARASTQEIARRAGVSRGAQLHHFPTREALVVAAVEHLVERRLAEFLTVDREAEAAQAARAGKAKERDALRLSVLIHLAGYLFGMLVFAGIGLGTGDLAIMKWPTIWWTVAMAGHGLVLSVVELVARHRQPGPA